MNKQVENAQKEPPQVKKMRFRGQRNFALYHSSSLTKMIQSAGLMENILEATSLILPPEYQQPAGKIPFQFWLETTFPISPVSY